jgi:uncharacterized metal-binding protein
MELMCGKCGVYACYTSKKIPDKCPMREENIRNIYAKSVERYLSDDKIRDLALNAARVEAEGYLRWSRVEETIEFARRCGFKRLGIAFCIGLRNEARILVDVLEKNGFEVYSVVCKSGSVEKEKIGLTKEEKIRPDGFEVICNPIAQAEMLNEVSTELNILFGLCVGHDTLFIMHSRAPVTCLVVKDRVLAHNPIGAIYASKHYYRRKLYQDHRVENGSEKR